MSSGTNQERIEQNNLKLTQLKTKADNLPDYQDIEPIYATGDFTKFSEIQSSNFVSNYFSIHNKWTISFLGNWAVTEVETTPGASWISYYLFDLKNNTHYILNNSSHQHTSDWDDPRASIIAETANYVYIAAAISTNERKTRNKYLEI